MSPFCARPKRSHYKAVTSQIAQETGVLCTYQFKAGGGGGGGEAGRFKNLPSNCLPRGKPFQSNAQKFSHPGRHIAVNHSQAGCKKDARKTGKLYNFLFSTLLHLQRYYLIKIQSVFNTLCISSYKINRFFKKQFLFSAKAAESITSEKSSHCSNWPVH